MVETLGYTPAGLLASAMRRHVALLVTLGVLGVAAGVGLALQQGIQYTATTSIMLRPLEGNPYAPDGRGADLVNLETEIELVKSEAVAAEARRRIDTQLSADELLQRLDVEHPSNAQTLRISLTMPSRTEALRGAQAFAKAYLDYRRDRAKALLDSRLAKIRRQQGKIVTELGDVQAKLSEAEEGSTEHAYLSERLDALASQAASLETEISTLTATDLTSGEVINPPRVPFTGGGANTVLGGAAGGLAGFGLALFVALLRTRADDRIQSPADLERANLRLLSVIREPQRFGIRAGRYGLDLSEPYRELRTTVVGALDSAPVTIGVTGASTGISSAPEAAGLATGLARAGFSVVLVDTDGVASQLLAGDHALPGLSDLLAGRIELADVLVQPDGGPVLVPFGAPRRNTMDQLLSPQMRSLVGQLREWYDVVMLSGRPITSADGQAIATLCDAMILVAGSKMTRFRELQSSMALLAQNQSYVLGAVMIEGIPARTQPVRTRASSSSRLELPRDRTLPERTPESARSGAVSHDGAGPAEGWRQGTRPRPQTPEADGAHPEATGTATQAQPQPRAHRNGQQPSAQAGSPPTQQTGRERSNGIAGTSASGQADDGQLAFRQGSGNGRVRLPPNWSPSLHQLAGSSAAGEDDQLFTDPQTPTAPASWPGTVDQWHGTPDDSPDTPSAKTSTEQKDTTQQPESVTVTRRSSTPPIPSPEDFEKTQEHPLVRDDLRSGDR
ncbi:MAG TPA: hypothetical protein VIL34_14260 [Actinopolymorphaceae bacterium]